MTKLHLLKNFNNYYNRQLKLKSTVNDYINDSNIFIKTIDNVNFDIQDGLFTEAIINYNAVLATPNYCIVETGTLVEGVWTSSGFTRWFVIESKQTRGLQYKLALKRDVIADHYATIRVSDCIIQKGYVPNNNVLVFNKEEQQYNKKKTKELLIKDNTGMGYVVGFIARNTAGSGSDKISTTYKSSMQVDFDYSSLDASIKNLMAIGSATPNRTTTRILNNSQNSISMRLRLSAHQTDNRSWYGNIYTQHYYDDGYLYCTMDGYATKANYVNDSLVGYTYSQGAALKSITENEFPASSLATKFTTYRNAMYNASEIRDFYNNYNNILSTKFSRMNLVYFGRNFFNVSDTDRAYLEQYNGKICEISGTYYKVQIQQASTADASASVANTYANLFKSQIIPKADEINVLTNTPSYLANYGVDDLDVDDIMLYAKTEQVYLQLIQQNNDVYTYLTPTANRNHLIDAPYDMFVIPYADGLSYSYNNTDYLANKNMAINLAQQLGEQSGTGQYDIQIVPFCPFTNILVEDGVPDFSLYNAQTIHLGADDSVIGYYFWAEKSSDSISISETRSELTLSDTPSYKELNQLYQYILCSPDKQSQWEFSPAMNDGITQWNISFNYRPFSSYVKVQPQWNWLYGSSEYNTLTDYRGLIYNANNSITQLNDAWETYLSSNKNYQAIFDTQIDTQIRQYDVQNKAAWETMFARSYSLGIINSGLKAYYNSKEQLMQEELQGISLGSQRRLFNYQLDNIQSQPKTLSKLTSIDIDYRIFPYVEIFEPTKDDLDHFRDMIKWNGMTIMCVGHIENYLQANTETFIQATLLRYNEAIKIENDYTMVQEINAELNKGIYITKEE